jgi:Tfp pilus assembly protein PilX
MRRQAGIALVFTLVVLVATLGVALAAARAVLNAQRTGHAARERALALAAAEAALADAERELEAAAYGTGARAALLRSGAGFLPGCAGSATPAAGLCAWADPPAWQVVDLAHDSARTVAYGSYTGAAIVTGGDATCCRPRYLIEMVPLVNAGAAADATAARAYRITAVGFGGTPEVQVVLQTVYRAGAT